MRLGIVAPIERPGQSELDGSFYAWVNPSSADGPASGDYPLVFDCPDAAMHDDLELPCVAPVQLAGFAHHLEIWDSVAEFDRGARRGRQRSWRRGPSSRPGCCAPEGVEDPPPPVAYAIINGHGAGGRGAREPADRACATSGRRWRPTAGPSTWSRRWALVTREIREGSVLSGGFWLSGQIVDDADDADADDADDAAG
jgi:hypothetical protein